MQKRPVVDLMDELITEHPDLAKLELTVYSPEGLRIFLQSPQPRFGGKTAQELIDEGQAEIVESALAEDYEGLGA